jgi:hypothetical protein
MKYDIEFTRPIADACVWIGETPQIEIDHEINFEILRIDAQVRLRNLRAAAVEISIPSGGLIRTGLLGGRFEPNDSGLFIARLYPVATSDQPISWSIAAKIDKMLPGLIEELQRAVTEGISAIAAENTLGSGDLIIDRAAHGIYGSSFNTFLQLTTALVALLATEASSFSEIKELLIPCIFNAPKNVF